MFNRRQIAHGVLWSSLANWTRQAIALAVFVVLARLLEPEAFGLLALASIFVRLARVLVQESLGQALVQRAELSKAHLDAAFWGGLAISGGLAIVLIVIAPLASRTFSVPELTSVLRWLSPVIVLNALVGVHIALLQRSMNFRPLALRMLIASSLGGAAGIALAATGFGVWSLVVQQLVDALAAALIFWRTTRWRPGLSISRIHLGELLQFGRHVAGTGLMQFANQRADTVIIGLYLGTAAVGLYHLAQRILQITADLSISAVGAVALPAFSRLQKDSIRLEETFLAGLRLTSAATFPLFLGLAAVAPLLVPGLLGQKWQDAVMPLQILLLAGPALTIGYFTSNLFLAMGKPHWRLLLMCGSVLFNVSLFLLVVDYGIAALAAVFVGRIYLFIPLNLLLARRLIELRTRRLFGALTAPAVGSAIMVLSVLGLQALLQERLGSFELILASIGAGGLAYCAVLFVQAPSLWTEGLTVLRSMRGSHA